MKQNGQRVDLDENAGIHVALPDRQEFIQSFTKILSELHSEATFRPGQLV